MINEKVKELARLIADSDAPELVEALKEAFKEVAEDACENCGGTGIVEHLLSPTVTYLLAGTAARNIVDCPICKGTGKKAEPEDDGYLYFGGEGQEKDPRLPAGVLVEGRDYGDDGWYGPFKYGFCNPLYGQSIYRVYDGAHYELLRVKRSEIIDIGERAVGRLVEAWDDGAPEDVFEGYCYGLHRGRYLVFARKEELLFDHVRLINNAEREG